MNKTRLLLQNIAALFITYLAVAIPLPVISLFVKNQLSLSNSLSGLAVGIGFLTTIFCVKFTGHFTDSKGGKVAMQYGLWLYVIANIICVLASTLTFNPLLAYAVLILGRITLGVGETMALVGMLSWNINLVGSQRSGIVFSLVGASIYGAFALGSPLGVFLLEKVGFTLLMVLCCPLPIIGLLIIMPIAASLPTVTHNKPNIPFLTVVHSIWQQGAIVCLQGVGFAVIGAFVALYFSHQGWHHSGFALTCFGGGFILVRLLFGHLPDKFNGYRIAALSLFEVACGQLCLWLAPFADVALLGAFLTGIGASLVYPAMGVEVVKHVPVEMRGIAVGSFTIFQDTAYGLTAPLTGFVADYLGYSVVFLIGFIAATLGMLIAITATRQKHISVEH